MKTNLFIWFSALLICVPTITAADKRGTTANKRDASILVEPDQLQKQLNDKNLRVLDVRSQNEYAKGHIPGALRVDVGDWKNLATADNGLHDAKGWAAKLAPLAITSKTHVVVYGGRLTDTARIWWLLKYLGVKNASLLNGSWESWAKSNRPADLSTEQVQATASRDRELSPRVIHMMTSTALTVALSVTSAGATDAPNEPHEGRLRSVKRSFDERTLTVKSSIGFYVIDKPGKVFDELLDREICPRHFFRTSALISEKFGAHAVFWTSELTRTCFYVRLLV